MKRIELVGGGWIHASDEQFDLLRHFRWQKCGFCGHVFRNVRNDEHGDFTIYIEAEIQGKETESVEGACNPCPGIRE